MDQRTLGASHILRSEPHRVFSPSHRRPEAASALVFLDTNVLLRPYRTSSAALHEIQRVYKRLQQERRLVVPAEAAREFARVRPVLLADLVKQVETYGTTSIATPYAPPSIVLGLQPHNEAANALQDAKAALERFRAHVKHLRGIITTWETSDPVLEVYGALFDASVVRDCTITDVELEKARKDRYDRRIPPGYEDQGKRDGGRGDLAIWMTVLEIAKAEKRDAIFVTDETKGDWFHRGKDDPLFVRQELCWEFTEFTGGRSFGIMRFAEFLATYHVDDEVIAEVERIPEEPMLAAREGEWDETRVEVDPEHWVSPTWVARALARTASTKGATEITYLGNGAIEIKFGDDAPAALLIVLLVSRERAYGGFDGPGIRQAVKHAGESNAKLVLVAVDVDGSREDTLLRIQRHAATHAASSLIMRLTERDLNVVSSSGLPDPLNLIFKQGVVVATVPKGAWISYA